MSKSTRIVFSIFLSLSFFFSIFISALRVMALEEFETNTHYFSFGARLSDIVNYLLFASVLIFFVCGLYLRGKIAVSLSDRGVPFYFGNAVLGASLAAYAIFSFPIFFTTDRLALSASPLSGILMLLCTLFAVLSVFFCIHNCLFPNAERNRRVLFGLSIPLFAILNVLALYFDSTTPLNAPNKIFDQFTYIFIALYLLYELRVLLNTPRYAAQCTLGFIAMVFTAANGFPSFIYMFTHGEPLTVNDAHDILMISFFVYVSIRMTYMLFSKSAHNNHVLDLLTEAEHPSAMLAHISEHEQPEEPTETAQLTFDTVNTADIEDASEKSDFFSEDGRSLLLEPNNEESAKEESIENDETVSDNESNEDGSNA